MTLVRPYRVAAVAVVLLSACSGSSSSSSSKATTITAAVGSSTTTVASSTTSAGPTTTSAAQGAAQNLLLTAAEVGNGFTDDPYSPGDPTVPLPCGQANVATKYTPVVKAGSDVSKGTLTFEEVLSVYSDKATRDGSFQYVVTGISCGEGTLHSGGQTVPITITGPQNVTSQVGGDDAEFFQVTSSSFTAVLIGVKLQTSVVSFTFLAPNGSDRSTAPAPTALAKLGVDRIVRLAGA